MARTKQTQRKKFTTFAPSASKHVAKQRYRGPDEARNRIVRIKQLMSEYKHAKENGQSARHIEVQIGLHRIRLKKRVDKDRANGVEFHDGPIILAVNTAQSIDHFIRDIQGMCNN